MSFDTFFIDPYGDVRFIIFGVVSLTMGNSRIAVAYGDSLKEDVFKDHVGRVSVKAIIRAAKERRPGALGYSEAMIIEYNKKSKFRLSLKTLYGGKQTSDEDEFGEE